MQMIVKKSIGKTVYTFVLEGKNLHECVMEAEKLSFPAVYKCDLCQSDQLVLGARIAGDQEFKYTEIKCLNCRGSLTFGQKIKDPDTFYLRRNDSKGFDWVAFKPKEN